MRLGPVLRTVRHLAPGQVANRVLLRTKREVYRRAPAMTERRFRPAGAVACPGWSDDFTPVYVRTEAGGHPSLEDNLDGRFRLLNEMLDLGSPINWHAPDASQLWRYHLHYFDWAWDLLEVSADRAADVYSSLYGSWRGSHRLGEWDAWSPYVVSLRAWTMCAIHDHAVAGRPLERVHLQDLATHARYLRANVEFDVGGNHLIKNLKALLALGLFLDDADLRRFAGRHLHRQLERQILADGGHFERSPGYHVQVLEDLTDVAGLLRAAGFAGGLLDDVEGAVENMRAWCHAIVMPDGQLPLLNDSNPLSTGQQQLHKFEANGRSATLRESGYAIRSRDRWHAVMDIGPPCPPELPAHAQADALNVVAHYNGRPILVDGGTSVYGNGPRRQYERSTRAHNTLEVAGQDSTEVYGAFRAGRRHRVRLMDDQQHVTAEHDGYRFLDGKPVHRRSLHIDDGALVIEDTYRSRAPHDVALYWHLAPGIALSRQGERIRLGDLELHVAADAAPDIEIVPPGEGELGLIGVGHGRTKPSACIVLGWKDTKRLDVTARFTPV